MRHLLPLIAFLLSFAAIASAERLPNVVVIFTDDQGYADVGVYGAEGFCTPNIDRMAAEGRKFTRFYVAQPVCSASRAALLTGCYPSRIGIHGALGPGATHGIHENEMTLAEVFKQKGYATAMFGKWHLGHHAKFLPVHHGFDEYLGIPYSNDMWPLHPDYVNLPPDAEGRKRGFPPLPMIEGDQIINDRITGEDQAQFTTQFTERAVEFIKKNKDQPFFLYVAHPMPHVPLFVSDKFRGKSAQGAYGDVIMEIDWSVGQILDAVKANGLDEHTLVIFTSDNGPWINYGDHAGSAHPLREAKGTNWEGGVRTPCVMRWPGTIPAGTSTDEPLMTIDLLPTMAKLIGAKLPDHPIDGLNVWPIIAGEEGAKNPHEAYFFYYHQSQLQAVMSGRWKLYFPHRYRTLAGRPGGTGGRPVPYDQVDIEYELYDLESDIGETTNVIADHPEVVERLKALAERARQDLGDTLTGVEGSGVREPGRL